MDSEFWEKDKNVAMCRQPMQDPDLYFSPDVALSEKIDDSLHSSDLISNKSVSKAATY